MNEWLSLGGSEEGIPGGWASGMGEMFCFCIRTLFTPECLLCEKLLELPICDLYGSPAYAVYFYKKFSNYQIKWGPLWGCTGGGGQEENQGWGPSGQG